MGGAASMPPDDPAIFFVNYRRAHLAAIADLQRGIAIAPAVQSKSNSRKAAFGGRDYFAETSCSNSGAPLSPSNMGSAASQLLTFAGSFSSALRKAVSASA